MFEFNEKESTILGYRIARGNGNSLDNFEALNLALRENEIDVLKLSIKNPAPNLYVRLDELKLPYYILGTTLAFKSIFARNPPVKEYKHDNLTFKEFYLRDKGILASLIKEIFKDEVSSFFINPALKDIDCVEKRLECLVAYICTFSKELDSSKYTHIMYYGETPIGFITSYKEGSGGGVLYAGILNEYIGRGFYTDLVRFIQNYGKSIGQKWGLAYVQIHHTVVQKTFIKEGLIPQGYILNIHINSRYGSLKT